jgi:hypothetical protein
VLLACCRRIAGVPPGINSALPVFTGVLSACAGVLPTSCPVAGMLPVYYRYVAYVFIGMLPVYYRYVAGVLPAYLRHAAVCVQ